MCILVINCLWGVDDGLIFVWSFLFKKFCDDVVFIRVVLFFNKGLWVVVGMEIGEEDWSFWWVGVDNEYIFLEGWV